MTGPYLCNTCGRLDDAGQPVGDEWRCGHCAATNAQQYTPEDYADAEQAAAAYHDENGQPAAGAERNATPDPGNGTSNEAVNPNVAAIRKALLEEPQSLLAAMREEKPAVDPMPGTGGLIARGEAHVLFGERGAGKSMVALILGLSAASRGERVLYLDRENGDAVTGEHARYMQEAHPEWADVIESGALIGSHWPEISAAWRGEDVAAALDFVTLLIIDNTREFIDQIRGENNRDDSISALYSLLVTPLRPQGTAVLLLDNTGHENTGRPKGAGAKLDAAATAIQTMTTREFKADQTGEIELACTRSRHGMIGRTWKLQVGGGIYELPHEPTPLAQADAGAQRTEVYRASLTALGTNPRLGRDPLIKAIRQLGITGSNDVLREHLADVASDPSTELIHDPSYGYSRGVAG